MPEGRIRSRDVVGEDENVDQCVEQRWQIFVEYELILN